MIWIPITVLATALQVARNALQRGLLPAAGPWGATLVRFLFGLPFSLLAGAVVLAFGPEVEPHLGWRFWLAAVVGGGCQLAATACLLVAMRRSGFALGAAFQQASLPIATVIGLVFGDRLSPGGLAGVALASAGLLALSWPRRQEGRASWSGAWLGLLSGAFFGVALNAFRQAALAFDPGHPVLAALSTLVVVQALQATLLTLALALLDPGKLIVVLASWRASLAAGIAGALGSGLWFTALALAPAASVRAVGVCEMPMAALAGRRLFRERLSLAQWTAGAVTAVGVVLAAAR